MKKTTKILILIILLCSLALLGFYKMKSKMSMPDTSETHIGGAVLKEPFREAPNDVYMDTGIVKTKEYNSYTKKMVVCGITFIAKDEIPDEFLLQVAKTTKEIFSINENTDKELQEKMLENMYKYKALIPVVSKEPSDLNDIMMKNSICDIIMNTSSNQALEVVEHILHTATDVGLHYTLTEQFGLTKESTLYKTMEQAINKKHFSIDGYKDYPESIKNRILLQEYVYWMITSAWNIQETYGLGEDEWTLKNSEGLKTSLPSAYDLYEKYIPKVMTVPNNDTLKTFGS